jgi:hypothetical protein
MEEAMLMYRLNFDARFGTALAYHLHYQKT